MTAGTGAPPGTRLALFDLDHTLLTGDSDALWCDFLMLRRVVDPAVFAAANTDMDSRYRAGKAGAQEFCEFYVSTLTGMTRTTGEALRKEFLDKVIRPRIPADARALVERHRQAGDVLVMTTATNRFITELTAIEFGIEHLIATEIEEFHGAFTGRTRDVLNMREGKVTRLSDWLAKRGWPQVMMGEATFYSDSINDLPLLSVVGTPVVVDADAKLAAEAGRRGWRSMAFQRA